MDYGRSELADRLAAAYAAGTLRGAARRRFEALLPAHPALRDAARAWQDQLMPLTAAIPEVQPPPRVWDRIVARLDGLTGGRAAAPAGARSGAAQGRPARLAFWRALAAFASVAAIGFATLLAYPGPTAPPVIVVLAPTAAGAAAPAIVAGISGDRQTLVTRPLLNVSVQPDRSLELWAIPAGGAPRSLGVIAAQGGTLAVRGHTLAGAETLAVTLEPPGGSPSGAPTGPVLYAGKVAP